MSERHTTPEELDGFILDDLDDLARREIAAHLQSCAACRRTAETMREELAAYRRMDPPQAGQDILERLLWVQHARRPAGPRTARRSLAGLAAAAAAGLIFMGGFWTGRTGDRTQTPPTGPAPSRTWSEEPSSPAGPATPSAADHGPPPVSFAVAEADHLGRLASRDTTWQ